MRIQALPRGRAIEADSVAGEGDGSMGGSRERTLQNNYIRSTSTYNNPTTSRHNLYYPSKRKEL